VFRFWNLRVMIYTKDHKPAHIHVIGPDAEIKFALGTWEIMGNRGFTQKTANEIRNFLKPRENEFLEAWNAIYEKEKN